MNEILYKALENGFYYKHKDKIYFVNKDFTAITTKTDGEKMIASLEYGKYKSHYLKNYGTTWSLVKEDLQK